MSDQAPEISTPASTPSVDASPSVSSEPITEQSAPQSYKLKVSGEEREFSLEELQKYAGMGFDAHSKWQEAAQLRKANDSLLKHMKENPKEFFTKHAKEFGFDLDAYSMEALAAQVEADLQAEAEAAMSPEERQYRQDQKELEQYRNKDKLTKAEQERQAQLQSEQQQVEADKQYETDTRTQIQDGLKANGLPYTNFTWNSVLQYMATAMDAGHEDVTPDQVMHLVKRDYQSSFDGLFEGDEEEIISRLGDDKIARIQQAVIKKAKGPGYQPQEVKQSQQDDKPIDLYDWDKQLQEVKEKIRRGEI